MRILRWTRGIAVAAAGMFLSDAVVLAQGNGTPPGGPELNLFGQTLQVLFALILTLVLLVGTVWLFRRILRGRVFSGVSGGAIRILEMQYLDPKKAVALVRVVDRVFILGYTESSLACLGELSPDEAARVEKNGSAGASVPFGNILARVMNRRGATARKDDSDAL